MKTLRISAGHGQDWVHKGLLLNVTNLANILGICLEHIAPSPVRKSMFLKMYTHNTLQWLLGKLRG